MRIDLERALEDIAGAAARDAEPVAVDRVLTRMRHRRAARASVTSAVGVAAAGSVALAANALMAAPTPGPAPAEPSPAPTEPSPAPSSGATPTPDPDPVPGWVAGDAPCGQAFTLEPVDGPRVELAGQVLHGAPDDDNLFTPGLGESWALVHTTAYPEIPGQALDHDGAAESSYHTFLVDEAGTVALWDVPTDEPARPLNDGEGTNLAMIRDAVDCRTGQPLAGQYRVFAVYGPGSDPWVSGDPGPDAEVKEFAPVVFGTGAEQRLPWVPTQSAPTCGQSLDTALAAGPEPVLHAELDPADVATLSEAGVSSRVTLTSAGGRVVAAAPQSLRALLVDEEGTVVSAPASEAFGSAAMIDTAGGPFETKVWQWWDSCSAYADGRLVAPVPPLTAGDTYDLYVWDVVDVQHDGGGTAPGTILGGPYEVTLTPW